jgi:hypothetical protein
LGSWPRLVIQAKNWHPVQEWPVVGWLPEATSTQTPQPLSPKLDKNQLYVGFNSAHLNVLGRYSFTRAEPVLRGAWRPFRPPDQDD